MPTFIRRTELPAPRDEAYAWHARPGALQRLMPPWQPTEVVSNDGLSEGSTVEFRLGPRAMPLRWIAEHRHVEPGRQFSDVQLEGPFARWHHTHRILPHDIDARRSVLEDVIKYELPLGLLGDAVAGRRVREEIGRMFEYRQRVARNDLARHGAHSPTRLSVAVTGASGFIGSQLCAFLTSGGHRVVRLVRTRREVVEKSRGELEHAAYWDPAAGYLDPAALHDVDAVIHLAGEPITWRRWTRAHRARILDSRVRGTRVLADAMASMPHPPRLLLSASGTAIYGDAGSRRLDEDSPSGSGYLADVTRLWEEAAAPAAEAGIRVCRLRFGAVMSPRGGPVGALRPLFRMGLGGTSGSGSQWVPWIAIDDAVYAIAHLLHREALHGPVNIVAPHPVSQRHLVGALGTYFRRPTPMRYPRSVLRLVGGRLAAAAALSSAPVVPERLANSGFEFAYPSIERALEHVLGREASLPEIDEEEE